MKLVHQSDRDAWLEARKAYCTASDVVVAMGQSPYMTRAELVDSKLGLFQRAQPDGESAALGLLLEEGLCKLVRSLWGWPVEEYGWLTSDDRCEALAATPDLTMQTPWGPALVDMKVTSAQAQEDCKPGSTARFANGCPLDYALQLQAQMACMGREYRWASILALHIAGGKTKLRAYPVRRSEAVIADIRDTAIALMREVNERREK